MFDTKFAVDSFSQIASVAPVTLLIAIVAAVVGLLLAILVAVVRERQVKVLAPIVAVIVSFVRERRSSFNYTLFTMDCHNY